MILLSARRAANYHVAGVECSETGNEDGAIENYNKAAVDLAALNGVSGMWVTKAGRSVAEMECTLDAEASKGSM